MAHGRRAVAFLLCLTSAIANWWTQEEASRSSRPVRNVLILGKTGNGKSTTGNVFAGKDVFQAADEMVSVTQTSQKMSWERFGVRYLFVDTPGIFDTDRSHEDIFREITNVIYLSPEGFHAILFQLDPSSRFTAEEERTIDGIVAVTGGKQVLEHVVLVFSHGEKWPKSRIQERAEQGRLPKGLLSLLEDVGHRIVSVDISSPVAMEESARAIHDEISRVMDRKGNRTYTNKHFEDAQSRLDKIAQSVDPEARMKAAEEEAQHREAELRRKLSEEREASQQREQDMARKLRTEMELEYARREMEAQKARHEEQLRLEKDVACKQKDMALLEQKLEQQQADLRQQAQWQREREARSREEMRREAEQQRMLAMAQTQQVVYWDTASRSSWCSVL